MTSWALKWFVPFVLIQSLGFYFAQNSLEYSSPFVFMALRYLIGAGFLIAISRKLLVNKWSITIAAVSALSTATWILGLQYVSPGDSAVLSSTGPLFAIPFAVLILSEKPLRWEIVGTLVGFSGVVLYSFTLSHGSLLEGALLTLVSAASWALFSVLFRKTRKEEPAAVVGSQYLLGSVPFIILAVFFPGVHFVPNFFIDLAFMAIPGGAVQLYLWNRMLQIQDVAKVTTMTFAIPALTIGFQTLITESIIGPTAAAGALMMFAGVYVSYRSKQRSKYVIRETRAELGEI
jgi:drug/metabolite transporter (DMT)-like permease